MRTLKFLGISYLIKTLLLGAAWLLIPDLPQRTRELARAAWMQVAANGQSAPAADSQPRP